MELELVAEDAMYNGNDKHGAMDFTGAGRQDHQKEVNIWKGAFERRQKARAEESIAFASSGAGGGGG